MKKEVQNLNFYKNNALKEIENKLRGKNLLNKRKYFYYFDFLRLFSSIAIVLIHVSGIYNKLDINSNNWKIAFYYNGISRFGVPNFIMISGALFLNRELSFNTLFKKYILRILLHLIFWSFIYSLYNITLEKDIYKIIVKFFKGHYHLWYLKMTINLYIIIPFLKEISSRDELLKTFLQLSFIFTFIFPNSVGMISFFNNILSKILKLIYSNFSPYFCKGFVFYFMYGYYLNNKIKLTFYKKLIIYFFGLIGLFITTIILYYISIKTQKKLLIFQAFNLNILAYSTGIFIFVKDNFNVTNIYKRKIIKKISTLTFGIYLIHPLIIYYIHKKNVFGFINKILLKIPLITFTVYLISYLICFIIKKIPFFGKLII